MDPKKPLTEEELRTMISSIYFRNKHRSNGKWIQGLIYASYCPGITVEEIEHLHVLMYIFPRVSTRQYSQEQKDKAREEFATMVNNIRKEGRKKIPSAYKTYIQMFNDPQPKYTFAKFCEAMLDEILSHF